jgi:hypothetical protein
MCELLERSVQEPSFTSAGVQSARVRALVCGSVHDLASPAHAGPAVGGAVEAGEKSGVQVNRENSLAANIRPFVRDKSGLALRRLLR